MPRAAEHPRRYAIDPNFELKSEHPDFRPDGVAPRVGNFLRHLTRTLDPDSPIHENATVLLRHGPDHGNFVRLGRSLAAENHPYAGLHRWDRIVPGIELDRHVEDTIRRDPEYHEDVATLTDQEARTHAAGYQVPDMSHRVMAEHALGYRSDMNAGDEAITRRTHLRFGIRHNAQDVYHSLGRVLSHAYDRHFRQVNPHDMASQAHGYPYTVGVHYSRRRYAFSPEQGGIDHADFHRKMAEDVMDPTAGLIYADALQDAGLNAHAELVRAHVRHAGRVAKAGGRLLGRSAIFVDHTSGSHGRVPESGTTVHMSEPGVIFMGMRNHANPEQTVYWVADMGQRRAAGLYRRMIAEGAVPFGDNSYQPYRPPRRHARTYEGCDPKPRPGRRNPDSTCQPWVNESRSYDAKPATPRLFTLVREHLKSLNGGEEIPLDDADIAAAADRVRGVANGEPAKKQRRRYNRQEQQAFLESIWDHYQSGNQDEAKTGAMIYADWLQEHGRDHTAVTIREMLQDGWVSPDAGPEAATRPDFYVGRGRSDPIYLRISHPLPGRRSIGFSGYLPKDGIHDRLKAIASEGHYPIRGSSLSEGETAGDWEQRYIEHNHAANEFYRQNRQYRRRRYAFGFGPGPSRSGSPVRLPSPSGETTTVPWRSVEQHGTRSQSQPSESATPLRDWLSAPPESDRDRRRRGVYVTPPADDPHGAFHAPLHDFIPHPADVHRERAIVRHALHELRHDPALGAAVGHPNDPAHFGVHLRRLRNLLRAAPDNHFVRAYLDHADRLTELRMLRESAGQLLNPQAAPVGGMDRFDARLAELKEAAKKNDRNLINVAKSLLAPVLQADSVSGSLSKLSQVVRGIGHRLPAKDSPLIQDALEGRRGALSALHDRVAAAKGHPAVAPLFNEDGTPRYDLKAAESALSAGRTPETVMKALLKNAGDDRPIPHPDLRSITEAGGVHADLAGSRLAYLLRQIQLDHHKDSSVHKIASDALRGDLSNVHELGRHLAESGHPFADRIRWDRVAGGVELERRVRQVLDDHGIDHENARSAFNDPDVQRRMLRAASRVTVGGRRLHADQVRMAAHRVADRAQTLGIVNDPEGYFRSAGFTDPKSAAADWSARQHEMFNTPGPPTKSRLSPAAAKTPQEFINRLHPSIAAEIAGRHGIDPSRWKPGTWERLRDAWRERSAFRFRRRYAASEESAFHRNIEENPHDPVGYHVYSDWLQERDRLHDAAHVRSVGDLVGAGEKLRGTANPGFYDLDAEDAINPAYMAVDNSYANKLFIQNEHGNNFGYDKSHYRALGLTMPQYFGRHHVGHFLLPHGEMDVFNDESYIMDRGDTQYPGHDLSEQAYDTVDYLHMLNRGPDDHEAEFIRRYHPQPDTALADLHDHFGHPDHGEDHPA